MDDIVRQGRMGNGVNAEMTMLGSMKRISPLALFATIAMTSAASARDLPQLVKLPVSTPDGVACHKGCPRQHIGNAGRLGAD
jgi:hypothetical protein